MTTPSGSWDWNNVFAFVQQPRERDLAGCGVFPFGNFADDAGGAHIRVEVLPLKTRVIMTPIGFGVLLGAFYVAGEKAAAERGERHQTDSELVQGRNDILLQIALPERIFALQRRD